MAVVNAADGDTDAAIKQSTGPTRPGHSRTWARAAFAEIRRSYRPGQRAAAVSPRKSAARPFNLPHNEKESELHVSVAELLDWILIPPAMFTTFPAGWGKLTKGTAGRLYASGLKKGMPDILVFAPKKVIGIELKVGANSLTSAQRTMHAKLQAVGVRVYVCWGINDVVIALKQAGIPYRQNNISIPPGETEIVMLGGRSE